MLHTGMSMSSSLLEGHFLENFKDMWIEAQFSGKSCLLICWAIYGSKQWAVIWAALCKGVLKFGKDLDSPEIWLSLSVLRGEICSNYSLCTSFCLGLLSSASDTTWPVLVMYWLAVRYGARLVLRVKWCYFVSLGLSLGEVGPYGFIRRGVAIGPVLGRDHTIICWVVAGYGSLSG